MLYPNERTRRSSQSTPNTTGSHDHPGNFAEESEEDSFLEVLRFKRAPLFFFVSDVVGELVFFVDGVDAGGTVGSVEDEDFIRCMMAELSKCSTEIPDGHILSLIHI